MLAFELIETARAVLPEALRVCAEAMAVSHRKMPLPDAVSWQPSRGCSCFNMTSKVAVCIEKRFAFWPTITTSGAVEVLSTLRILTSFPTSSAITLTSMDSLPAGTNSRRLSAISVAKFASRTTVAPEPLDMPAALIVEKASSSERSRVPLKFIVPANDAEPASLSVAPEAMLRSLKPVRPSTEPLPDTLTVSSPSPPAAVPAILPPLMASVSLPSPRLTAPVTVMPLMVAVSSPARRLMSPTMDPPWMETVSLPLLVNRPPETPVSTKVTELFPVPLEPREMPPEIAALVARRTAWP